MMTAILATHDTSLVLHQAAAWGDLDLLRELIGLGHSVDARDSEGYTPFLVACKQAEPDIFHALLESGADFEATNRRGMNALFLVATNGIVSLARDLLDLGADVNRPAARGLTPLIAAIMSENSQLVQLLVQAGANVRHVDDSGTSVLRWARKLGSREMFDFVRVPDRAHSVGRKSLDRDDFSRAARTGDVDLIHECLAVGLEVDEPDSDGYTPLMLAARQHKRAAIEVLLEAGADPTLPSPNGLSPVLLAASSPVALRPFAECGVDFNDALRSNGTTPLMHASRHGFVDVARFLLSTGADPLIEDRAGLTALDHAHANGHRRIAHLLRDAMI